MPQMDRLTKLPEAPQVAQAFQPAWRRLTAFLWVPRRRTEGPHTRQAGKPAPRFRPAAAARGTRAFSIAEIVVSLAILMAGIVAIASFFPMTLRHNQRAVDSSIAAYLAQLKAEEIRRDQNADVSGVNLIDAIQSRTAPTDPVTFAPDPRFAYSFCGQSLLNPKEPPSARVIVGYSKKFRPRLKVLEPGDADILFELVFQ
jgi:type II secretory pathway pseudopilin PulG